MAMDIEIKPGWAEECRKVKTMADAIILLHQEYRGWCYDMNSYVSLVDSDELQLSYAGWMLDQMKANAETWPTDKLNRWLGFVQAILVLHGLTTVDVERDRTRPIFHAIYHREGIIPPGSVDMSSDRP